MNKNCKHYREDLGYNQTYCKYFNSWNFQVDCGKCCMLNLNNPCEKAICRFKEKKDERNIKWEREHLIEENICPDCGEDLTTKILKRAWWIFKVNYYQRICCDHGILIEYDNYNDPFDWNSQI